MLGVYVLYPQQSCLSRKKEEKKKERKTNYFLDRG